MSIGRIAKKKSHSAAGFPEAGRIAIGELAETEKGTRPQALDFFVARGNYAGQFMRAYGEKPQVLTVLFYSDDPGECCRQSYIMRDGAGRLVAESDGDAEFRLWTADKNKPGGGSYSLTSPDGQPYTRADFERLRGQFSKGKITQELRLRFLLRQVPVLGYWQFTTRGAESSIPQIVESFDYVAKNAGERLTQIPFDLSVSMHTSNKPGASSRYPVVRLTANLSQEALDRVQFLPADGITGVLTDAKILSLAPPEKLLPSAGDPEQML